MPAGKMTKDATGAYEAIGLFPFLIVLTARQQDRSGTSLSARKTHTDPNSAQCLVGFGKKNELRFSVGR
jgi:hypothetical protein